MPAIPGTGIDFSNWPAWLVFLLLILNLFKAQIGKGWASLFKLKEDQQEHTQDIEANLVDHDLQTKAAEQLRESQRESRAWNVIAQKDSYLHQYLNGKVDELLAGQEATRQEVAGLREDLRTYTEGQATGTAQTNSLLKELTVILARRQG